MAVSALLLGFMMFNLTSCGKDEENGGNAPTQKESGGKDDDGNKDSGKDDDQSVVVPDVVVTVDDSGQADGGHNFQRIDDTNFYIDDIKYTAEQGDLVVTGYDKAFFKGAAVIISTLKYQGRTMDVTSIKDEAFMNCSVLTSVTIGNGVTSIGSYAFSSCSGLTSVTIPGSVKSIGREAFYHCYGLTSVHITDLAAWCKISFSDYAYSNPLSYAHHLYLNNQEITDLVIPDGVTSIGMWAFYGCSSLTSITIPNSVTSIGEGAFYECSGLTSVTIPNSVTSIGNYAFQNCSGLTSVTTPNGVTSIGAWTFSGCSVLTSVTIPNSVTSIEYYAFRGCSSLTDVYCFAERVPTTNDDVFNNTPISTATLHVPAAALDAYKKYPWIDFKEIVALTDEEMKLAVDAVHGEESRD